MPKWLNVLIQAVGLATSGFSIFGGFLPPETAKLVVTGIAAVQAAIGVIAQHFNPDGTPATQPYVKK